MTGSFKELMDRVFSDEFVHADVNVVQLVMYRSAYPFAVLFKNLRLSPNLITTLSLIFTILAFTSLIVDEGWAWFALFWGVSVLLDFCDGTVARMTDKVSKTAFRYDHMSDIFKLCLVVLGVGIRNDDLSFWILCATFIFTYTYSEILSHDLLAIRKRITLSELNSDTSTPIEREDPPVEVNRRLRERFYAVRLLIETFPSSVGLIRALHEILFRFNGHTLLFLFLLPVGGYISLFTLTYLILLTFMSVVTSINLLRCTSR